MHSSRGGLEQDRSLLDWGENVYFAGLTRVTPEDVCTAVELNVAEGLLAGVTTMTDNWAVYGGPDYVDECAAATLEVYERAGVRVLFARMFSDLVPDTWAGLLQSFRAGRPPPSAGADVPIDDADTVLASIEKLIHRYRGRYDGRISICASPVQAQFVSTAGLRGAFELAERFGTVVPIHHCETEVDAGMFAESGLRLSCTDHLRNLGMLGPRLLAAHCVHVDARDVRLLAAHDVKVAHCPSSNMMLAAGIAPVAAMAAAGITIGLGTDNTNLNSNVSILIEMRHAALLAKVATGDPGAITSERVLEMATIDGARSLGMGDEIGSIEIGKRADMIILDTDRPHWYPRHHLSSVLAFQAHTSDVRTVIVDGTIVVRDRHHTFLQGDAMDQLYRRAQRASEQLAERAGLAPDQRGWQSTSRN